MYDLFFVILLFLILLLIFGYCRKQQIICRISRMLPEEKENLLNELAAPFGFCYDMEQDVFSTRTDAWQKSFGYGKLYDLAAPSMNMILDTQPVYFNYRKKTWLIQFWKGQYGISAGAEIGIYHAGSVIPPALRGQTLFQAAEENEMLPMGIRLISRGEQLFSSANVHWWLTGFLIGKWIRPSDLTAEYTVTFPDSEMCGSFLTSLMGLGYSWYEVKQEGLTLRFVFSAPKSPDPAADSGWQRSCALRICRLFSRIYQKITGPFTDTADRLLYLYEQLPFAFSRTVCPRTFQKSTFRKYGTEQAPFTDGTFRKHGTEQAPFTDGTFRKHGTEQAPFTDGTFRKHTDSRHWR